MSVFSSITQAGPTSNHKSDTGYMIHPRVTAGLALIALAGPTVLAAAIPVAWNAITPVAAGVLVAAARKNSNS